MEIHNITNQAKIIRDSVKYYLDYVKLILQKDTEIINYNDKLVNSSIKEAIDTFELNTTFYEELKQKISPIKVSILMLNDFLAEPEKITETSENLKNALFELESLIKRHFEEPKPIRHIRKFDILYIEDNELERETVNTYFKRKGLDIKSVETSEDGLDILKVSTPQAILLDLNLKTSNIDGLKLCQKLKASKEYKLIPIILISALVTEKEKKEILEKTNADDIIIKPIDKLADLDLILKKIK
ncbi:MAG: PleD family two-component system response regulator [Candidatus Thorarchaeota archaeon]